MRTDPKESPLPTRRRFLAASVIAAVGLAPRPRRTLGADPRVLRQARAARGRLRVTDIEVHEILPPYQDYNSTTLLRYHGVRLQTRTIYVVKTNRGMEGLGESWGPAEIEPSELAKYAGSDVFDWIGDRGNLPINMAMYDLMGKFLGLPAWKLIGPSVRSRIPVAAWTVSRPPREMAEEVRSVARRGYRWLKYHVDEIQNVVDQTAAMQEVAPPGFRVHYDFNASSSYAAVRPVLEALERFPVVGRIEDPITPSDRDGWRRLREQIEPQILVHHGPADFLIAGLCDGLMAGHAPVGEAAKIAAVAEAIGKPIMLQQAGGTINQAFLAHEASVLRPATIDHVNLCHLWKDDVIRETMPVKGGTVAVPTGPGLGVSLDRDKLQRYERTPPPKPDRFLVRIRYRGGPTIYCRHDPALPGATDNLRSLRRLLGQKIPGPEPGYANAVTSDFRDDTDSLEFQLLWRRTEKGHVVVRD